MGIRFHIANAASSLATWALQKVAHRQGGNVPGRVGLALDPKAISSMREKIEEGSIVVVGTNGKTTVTNLIADALEQDGKTVCCNRSGANLDSGIATALFQSKGCQWAVLECDELWSAKVVPQLKPTYVVLLNLFRDQLDRCGEIDLIQDAIASGLEASPSTVLLYNADDPLCEMIAKRIDNADGRARQQDATDGKALSGSNRTLAFGTTESMGLQQNRVSDANMCQVCSGMLEYDYRQYGQLGKYECPSCGFSRSDLGFYADGIELSPNGVSFLFHPKALREEPFNISSRLSGSYMVYNLLAAASASLLGGCDMRSIEKSIELFNPNNGRLQRYRIGPFDVLLNLAKNPTGFNQNLRIVTSDDQPKKVAFFINDKINDGFDISWIWDIDFEELAAQPNVKVYAGGTRRCDLQVRLKYAGIDSELIDSIEDVLFEGDRHAPAESNPSEDKVSKVYAIANYTALWPVKEKLDALCASAGPGEGLPDATTPEGASESATDTSRAKQDASRVMQDVKPVVIAHVLPELLNLYGDGGNVTILRDRLERRGIPVEVRQLHMQGPFDLSDCDIVFIGGAPDKEERLASEQILAHGKEISDYVEGGGTLLAICGGYQMLGRTWLLDGQEVEGIGLLDMETKRPGDARVRLVNNIALESPLASKPVIGYENHAGRTYLGEGVKPFGKVVSKDGKGNNDTEPQAYDGVIYKNMIGTYLHGPLLSKNPEIADWLLERAVESSAKRNGEPEPSIDALDDSAEIRANEFMAKRII